MFNRLALIAFAAILLVGCQKSIDSTTSGSAEMTAVAASGALESVAKARESLEEVKVMLSEAEANEIALYEKLYAVEQSDILGKLDAVLNSSNGVVDLNLLNLLSEMRTQLSGGTGTESSHLFIEITDDSRFLGIQDLSGVVMAKLAEARMSGDPVAVQEALSSLASQADVMLKVVETLPDILEEIRSSVSQ